MSRVSRLEPRREVLDNGIVLLWNEAHDTPSVAIRGSFTAGAVREPVEKAGLASFTARLLRRGTDRHTAQEISETVDAIGGSFNTWAGTEEAGFSAKCLGGDVEGVLSILQEVLERPAFAEAEMEKTRGEVLTQLREQDDNTRARADRAIQAALYPPEHPYSRPSIGDRETVTGLARQDLVEFHREYYGARRMAVSIAGAVDADQVRAHLERWFKGRPAPPPQKEIRAGLNRRQESIRLPMPHKSQADIIIAGPGVPRQHPRFFALMMVSLILGGLGLMGRLGERVREQLGIAYHVSCRSLSRLWGGEWVANAGVGAGQVDAAVEAILDEVRRMRAEPVTEQELADAQSYLIGSMPLRMETNDGIASYLLNVEYYGLGLDYVYRYPDYIRAETRETLRETAREFLDPGRLSTAMAGPL